MWLINKIKSLKKSKTPVIPEKLEFNIYRHYSSGGRHIKHYEEDEKVTYWGLSTISAVYLKGQEELGTAFCYALERPLSYEGKVNNKDDIGTSNINESCCIPAGTYSAKYTYSPKFEKYTYELFDVKNRKAIRIHSANHMNDLLGCIAFGRTLKSGYLEKGNFYDYYLTDSRATIKKFENFCKGKNIVINIIENGDGSNWKYVKRGIEVSKK